MVRTAYDGQMRSPSRSRLNVISILVSAESKFICLGRPLVFILFKESHIIFMVFMELELGFILLHERSQVSKNVKKRQ